MKTQIFESWQMGRADHEIGTVNTMAVAPTGGGKTAVMSGVVDDVKTPTVSIAHRQELVSQISLSLAKNDIYHRIIAAESVSKFCISRHIEELGKNFCHQNAPDAVSSVQTIIRRKKQLDKWLPTVGMWNIDEGHHVCPDNSWGKATDLFPNAFGLAFTASPFRADRKPLGRVNDGVFDHMVKGPSMRDLIDQGYLTEYRLIAPTISIDRHQIKVSESNSQMDQ